MLQCFSKRLIKRINRTISLPCGNLNLPVHFELELCKRRKRFFDSWHFAARAIIMQREKRLIFSDRFSHQQFKARVCALKLIAFVLKVFHFLHDVCNNRAVFRDGRVKLADFFNNHTAPRNFAHQEHAAITHAFGRNVLISGRIFQNRVNVHTRFMRKRRRSNVRHSRVKSHIRDFCHAARYRGQLLDFVFRNALIAHFQLQVCDNRGKICVARALAKAQKRALNVRCSCLYGYHRVRHRKPAIVVRVDSDRARLAERLYRFRSRFLHIAIHRAALCFAQTKHTRAALYRRLKRLHCVIGIFFIARKKMLCVINNRAIVLAKIAYGVANHLKIFVKRGVENVGYLKIPRFAEDNDVFRFRAQKALQIRVLGARRIFSPRRTERNQFRRFQLQPFRLLKKLHIFWIAAGISSLNKSHSKLVQSLHDIDFVLHRIAYALALRAVTQR